MKCKVGSVKTNSSLSKILNWIYGFHTPDLPLTKQAQKKIFVLLKKQKTKQGMDFHLISDLNCVTAGSTGQQVT